MAYNEAQQNDGLTHFAPPVATGRSPQRQGPTAQLRRLEPWIAAVGGLGTVFIAFLVATGFGISRPTERVAAIEASVDSLGRRMTAQEKATEEVVTALRTLIDAKCVELTPQQASYVAINCSRVYARIRNAEAIQRGRTGGPPP